MATENETGDFDREITRFVSGVRSEFGFLVTEKGFAEPTILERDRDNWYEHRVAVRFPGRAVGVEIELRFADPSINVSLIALDNGRFPEKYSYYGDAGYQPAIGLDSLVEYLTNGVVLPVLPASDAHRSIAGIGRDMDLRKRMIERDMKGVLMQSAQRLQQYGETVLSGDLSVFPKVADFHRRKYYGA